LVLVSICCTSFESHLFLRRRILLWRHCG